MLSKLSIQNFALIDQLNLDLDKGFTVITGETGAGKSIILGAIDLILGKRADTKSIFNPSKKCIVEAFFSNSNTVNDLLNSFNLDVLDYLIIRREIGVNGISRTFVNDSPVKLSQLRQITSKIIEINGQHITTKVGDLDFNYDFIDGFIGNDDTLTKYKTKYNYYKNAVKDHNALSEKSSLLKEKKDFLEYQIKELSEFPIENWNEEELVVEFDLISNQEEIIQKISLIDDLYSGSHAVKENLESITQYFDQLSKNIAVFSDFHDRIKSVNIELNDLFYELSNKVNLQYSDTKRVKELEELISTINFLIKKFNVIDLNDLKLKKSKLESDLSSLSDLDKQLNDSSNLIESCKANCISIGNHLFKKRNKVSDEISKRLNSILHRLSMTHADIKVIVNNDAIIHSNGTDSVDVMISANKGAAYSPIKAFSSGGELSRIVLAMKSLLNESNLIDVLIFDEIDAGVSGKTASEIGLLLKDISSRTQIICVTHLPQVAAMGNVHLHVTKDSSGHVTRTEINKLNRENRLQILATMLGGEKTGRAALDNAAELLN
jgi:DNA repair protein RecN (Recombination protein N)